MISKPGSVVVYSAENNSTSVDLPELDPTKSYTVFITSISNSVESSPPTTVDIAGKTNHAV